MPKMKTNRGAAKRFKVSGSGKVKRYQAGARHILTSKAPKRKRQLRRGVLGADVDMRSLRRLLPYGF
jgi:large subunit ribosomal protein L35